MPIIIKSIYETDVNYKVCTSEKNDLIKEYTPKLYYLGQRNTIFTSGNFFLWLSSAFLHSLMVSLVTCITFDYLIMDKDGKNSDMWSFSAAMFFSIILIVTFRLCITERLFNLFNILSITVLNLLTYYIYFWFSNFFTFSKTYLVGEQLHQTPIFCLVVFLCTGLAVSIDLAIETIKLEFLGLPSEYMRATLSKYKQIPENFGQEFWARILGKNLKD